MSTTIPSPLGILTSCYQILLLFLFVYSLIRFRSVNMPAKVICVLIWNGCLTELLAWYAMQTVHHNLRVYSISSLLEFFIICIFFNYTLPSFSKRSVGILIGAVGTSIGVANTIFLQPLHTINSNFLFLECLTVVCLSLYLTFRMLITMDVVPGKEAHFWFAGVLLFYQTSTLWIWAIYEYVNNQSGSPGSLALDYSLMIVAIITYSAYALLLYLYPKLKRSYV